MNTIKEVVQVQGIMEMNNGVYVYSFKGLSESLVDILIIAVPGKVEPWYTSNIIMLDIIDFEYDIHNKITYVLDYDFIELGNLEDCHTFHDDYNNEDIVIHKMEFPDTTHFQIKSDNGRVRAYHVGEWEYNKPLSDSIRKWLINQNTIRQATEGLI